jgi:Dna[CI] antecedent, DciA
MSSRTSLVSRPAHSVKQLFNSSSAGLRRVTDQLAKQNYWEKWLAAHLAAELRAHLSGIAEQGGTLTLFASSAAWAARLRFAVAALEADMRSARADLVRVEVKVLPRS